MYREDEAYKLPENLRVPIAARDLASLRALVGECDQITGPRTQLVTPRGRAGMLAGTGLPGHARAHQRLSGNAKQVWVHVDHGKYRKAYERGLPDDPIAGLFIDHILNRRLARELGYLWLRLCPVRPIVNTQGGRGLERIQVETQVEGRPGDPLERLSEQPPLHAPGRVGYAGAFEICKMLDEEPGPSETNPMVQQIYAMMYNH